MPRPLIDEDGMIRYRASKLDSQGVATTADPQRFDYCKPDFFNGIGQQRPGSRLSDWERPTTDRGRAPAGGQRRRAERPGWRAVDHERDVNVVVWEFREIDLIKPAAEFPGQVRRVLCADPEREEGPGIPQDCVPDVWLKLVQVLMGDREAHPVLPQFGKHVGERQRRERLEFVNIYEEIAAARHRRIGSAVCGQADGRYEERSEQR